MNSHQCCDHSKSPSQSPLLSVKELSVSFSGKTLIENVSFEVQQSTVTSIVGPSGSGKTTLLRSLNRLLDEDKRFHIRGQTLLENKNIRGKAIAAYSLRRCIGIVFQKPAIYPISIEKNVLFGLRHLRLAPKRDYPEIVERYLRKTFLWDEVKDRLDKSALELSVGQQQRLAIARSLAVEPKIILMDEPTSALDARASEKIEELILSLKTEHTILIVTHQQKQAVRIADWLLCLQPKDGIGQLVFSGTPDQFESSTLSH